MAFLKYIYVTLFIFYFRCWQYITSGTTYSLMLKLNLKYRFYQIIILHLQLLCLEYLNFYFIFCFLFQELTFKFTIVFIVCFLGLAFWIWANDQSIYQVRQHSTHEYFSAKSQIQNFVTD